MHCGTGGTVGAYACIRCGERLYIPDPERPPPLGFVRCSDCGSANESHASYCAVCAAEINDSTRISPGAHSDRAAEDHRDASGNGAVRGVALLDDDRSDRNRLAEPPRPAASVQREEAPLPNEIRGWNWAAFLLGPIWGVGHRIWWTAIGFLALAPFLNVGPRQAALFFWLAFMLYLGLRGNELAWRARRWESVDKFVAAQQRWGLWAFGVVAVLVAGLVVYMYVQ